MTTEVPGAPDKREAVDGRRRQRRRAPTGQAPKISQEDYVPALPAWHGARAFPATPIDPERERDEIRRQALELIDRLLERRPPSWPPTVADDDEAREALLTAGQLFGMLAGWAVSHELAAAARRAGVKLGPTQLWVPSAHERLLPSDGTVILHQLDAILRIFQGCFELSGCELIRDQIRALLAGYDSIVFRPQRHAPHGKEGYRLWIMRARAVAHAEHLVVCGVQRTKARERVAAAYRQPSTKNIATWGRRATEILGKEFVDWLLDRARQEAKEPGSSQNFGEAQLQQDGENFWQLMKGKEPIGPDKARSTVLILRSPDRPGVHIELRGPQAPRKTPENPQS
jgi:hypothetical protein